MKYVCSRMKRIGWKKVYTLWWLYHHRVCMKEMEAYAFAIERGQIKIAEYLKQKMDKKEWKSVTENKPINHEI